VTYPAFQEWLDRFFASYFRHRPVSATFIGEHAHNHALPDYSVAGVEAALGDAEALLREAVALDEALLDSVERMDKRLAEGFLRIQQWEFQSAHFRRGNPSLYTGEAIFGAVSLFLTAFAPLAERAAAAVERMNAVPRLLEQAAANVRAAPAAWTERALRECAGARAFFGPGIDLLAASKDVAAPALRRAADAALAAFARYEAYLRDELGRAGDSATACGGEVFDLLLREGHALAMTGDDVAAYAAEQLAAARARIEEQAAAFGAGGWQEALASLADLHPTTEGYLARYQECWDASRALSDAQGLLTWPDFPIAYVPQPEWAREAAPFLYFLFYRAPAAFNRPPVHHYLVTPIEASMPPDEQERRLRAANDSVIKLNHVVHHGGIGHHVQNWHAYHGPSRVGQVAAVDTAARIAMFCGGTMAEGWACYATTLMGEAGFLTPLETFSELQTDLRMAARALVDVRLHQGRMTLDEAAAFYAENTGMSQAASHGEAVKNSMFPGAAMIYLIGRDEILRLRADLRAQLGPRFDLRRFHDRFLSFGSVPVALAAEAMRAEAQRTEVADAQ
jgi:uncharacterized protein (DUF885 family)